MYIAWWNLYTMASSTEKQYCYLLNENDDDDVCTLVYTNLEKLHAKAQKWANEICDISKIPRETILSLNEIKDTMKPLGKNKFLMLYENKELNYSLTIMYTRVHN